MSFLAEQEDAEAAHVPGWHIVEPLALDSLHGTHQLHRFVGRWSGGDVGEWAVLTDKASGEAVLDMAQVKTGSAVWRADGCLLVRLRGQRDERLLIVDPGIGRFRSIGYDAAPRPVADLQIEMMRAARQVGADGRPAGPDDIWVEHDFGPDGHVMVEYAVQTQLMSHETRTPRIIDIDTGEVLVDLDDSLFDGSVTWIADGKLSLYLRHYSLGGGMAAEIDPGRRTWFIPGQRDGPMPLTTISTELPRRYRQIATARMSAPISAQARTPWTAYAFLLGLIVVIAGFAYFTLSSRRTEPQKLTPLPTFPIKK